MHHKVLNVEKTQLTFRSSLTIILTEAVDLEVDIKKCVSVRVSPVALWFRSEMDPYWRDLTNILHSYLVSDSLGPVLGARAWSCKTANNYLGLSRLRNTSEIFGEMSQVATRTFNVLYYFPFIWFIGSHYPRSYI